jgi:cation transport ATPase
MAEEFAPSATRFQSHPVVLQVCRGLSHVFSVAAYLGLLIAPSVVISLPIQLAHSFRVAGRLLAFYVSVALASALVLWALYRFGSAAIHSVRQRVVHVDALVGFVGVLLAIACHVFLISERGGF